MESKSKNNVRIEQANEHSHIGKPSHINLVKNCGTLAKKLHVWFIRTW
jgi:hypothetical protein